MTALRLIARHLVLHRPGGNLPRRVLFGALMVLTALLPWSVQAAVSLDELEWIPTDVGALPSPDARGTRMQMPLRWSAAEQSPLAGVTLRARFTLQDAPTETWSLLLTQASTGGLVSINGKAVGTVRMSDAATTVNWRRPHVLTIEQGLLRSGDNELLVQTTYRGGTHFFGGVELMPLSDVAAAQRGHYFASATLPWVGATFAAAIALLLGVLWLRHPDPPVMMLTLAATAWVGRSAHFLIEVMSVGERFWLLAAYFACSGAFAFFITLTLLRLSRTAAPRAEACALALALLGPLLLVLTAQHSASYLQSLWLPALIAMTAVSVFWAIGRRLRALPAPQPVALATAAIALLAALHDWMLSSNLAFGGGTLWLHWAGPLALLGLATPMIDRFARSLGEAESARALLETRVREREQLLKRNYERLWQSEKLQAQAQERQRIMQDMHDGLGSQLLSSLMLVERSGVEKEQMAQILRESIDDMRLAIDALSTEDTGLLAALGNLRFRMEPRLRAAGIALSWNAHGLPEEIDVNHDAVLPILRIVQEALTNTLKHSQARKLSVSISVEESNRVDWLVLRIVDNGCGELRERSGGRGLLNMRSRAGRIGAQLSIAAHPGTGTAITLRYQLKAASTQGDTQPLNLNTEAVIERVRRV
jgi:signal transduction histidine kinase